MIYSQLVGTGSYLPRHALSNHELSQRVDTSDEWIRERTGIVSRHVADPDETVSMMGAEAAQAALAFSGLSAHDIDLIVVATSTPEHAFPSVAGLIQHRLGISGCPAFDVGAACAGFVYAWTVADQFIRAGTARCALVVGTETMTRLLDWTDRSTCVLFGDGAGAAILKAADEPGVISSLLKAEGHFRDSLYVDAQDHIQMKGKEVYKGAVKNFYALCLETLADAEKKSGHSVEMDWFIPHQANRRIIESTAERLNLPMEKVVWAGEEQANTSAASIPLALDKAIRAGWVKKGQRVLLEGFGAGWAAGASFFVY